MARADRRRFLKAVAAVGLPIFVPASALGRNGETAPGNRIQMAAIGLGFGWPMFLREDVRYVAVCDVRRERRDQGVALVESKQGTGGCTAYGDFREVLDQDSVDAVYIATPDHWHAVIATAAARAGKHVYCQKPLTRTVAITACQWSGVAM